MVNAYLFAIRENADDEQRDKIDEALTPPLTARAPDGRPAWYGSDEDAWGAFSQSFPQTR